MKLDFTKHLAENRRKRVNTFFEVVAIWVVLTSAILGCLWILSGK